jgi:hypothetical protein
MAINAQNRGCIQDYCVFSQFIDTISFLNFVQLVIEFFSEKINIFRSKE